MKKEEPRYETASTTKFNFIVYVFDNQDYKSEILTALAKNYNNVFLLGFKI